MMNTDLAAQGADHLHVDTKSHAVLLTVVILAWLGAYVAAFALFGLGGLITAATFAAWIFLALIVVMTAGG